MRTPRLRNALPVALASAVLAALTACGGTSAEPSDETGAGRATPPAATGAATPSPAAAAQTAPPTRDSRPVYVAVGASETVGVGADDPAREAWPHLLHERALRGSTYVNVGVSGATVGEALAQQLPQALAAEPDVVTVWLAVNDITHLVPVEAYEAQLRALVHQLRRDGQTRVLVGNVPAVQDLPAYRACLPGAKASAVECSLPLVPPEAQVAATVAEFNAAVHRVVRAEGAQIVDLSTRRDLSRLTGTDGFHPSTEGHRRIAKAFARALES